jgi:hypothetical protein
MTQEEGASSLERQARSRTRGVGEPERVAPSEAERREREQEEARREAARGADRKTLIQRLAGKPATDVHGRISSGDPMGLYPVCVARMRERAFVLDPDRLFERALIAVAIGMELEPQRCSNEGWLLERVDLALRVLLERDRDAEEHGLPPERPNEHYRLFVQAFFVDPLLARRSSVRYNALEERIRRGFQLLILDGLPLDEVLARGMGPPERLQLDILLGLKAIGLLDDEGVEELRWKGEES